MTRPLKADELELLTAILARCGDAIREEDPFVFPILCDALLTGQIEKWDDRLYRLHPYYGSLYRTLVHHTMKRPDATGQCLAACYSILMQLPGSSVTCAAEVWKLLKQNPVA